MAVRLQGRSCACVRIGLGFDADCAHLVFHILDFFLQIADALYAPTDARMGELTCFEQVPCFFSELLVHAVPVSPQLAYRQALSCPSCRVSSLKSAALPQLCERVGKEILGAAFAALFGGGFGVVSVVGHGRGLTGASRVGRGYVIGV